jgi:hypothetical protein
MNGSGQEIVKLFFRKPLVGITEQVAAYGFSGWAPTTTTTLALSWETRDREGAAEKRVLLCSSGHDEGEREL